MAKIKPAPGIILIKPDDTKNTVVVVSNGQTGRLHHGTIVDIGSAHILDSGKALEVPCKIGQTAYFLSYEGNYDSTTIDGEKYYFVLFRDLRGYK